jgi:hypothetical protein
MTDRYLLGMAFVFFGSILVAIVALLAAGYGVVVS